MNNQQLWQAILGNLELTLSKGNFNTWFKNTSILERGPDYIIVSVPSVFYKDWISAKFHSVLLKVLKSVSPEIKDIKYQVGGLKTEVTSAIISEPVAVKTTEQPAATVNQAPKSQLTHSIPTSGPAPVYRQQAMTAPTGLNVQYIFDTFIIGKNNELAHAASVAVAKNPGSQYNPLFIYGGVGLGKTHLMHAVGNRILADNPNSKILYVTSEKFTNDYITAIGQKRMEEFKRVYRGVDVLLIDDIQFIAGKEGTQEEFFHTFNELRDKGKQIILTSDRLPKDIPSIEQRLISRFEWGMVADIQAPNLETRMAILRTKVAKKGLNISEEVINYIAENVVSNIRELEGALNRIMISQERESANGTITLDEAKECLANMVTAKKKAINMQKIASMVAEFYQVTMEDILKQSRRKEHVKPRQTAMYLARKELNSSFPTIGEFFGGRDHTTVMHGVDKIEASLQENDTIKQEIELILDKIYSS